METPLKELAAPVWVLTVADRCDACPGQAYYKATMPGGTELLFCYHHGRMHGEKVQAVASEWLDESARLG